MLVTAGFILSKSFIVFLVLEVISGLGHAMWIPAYIAMVAERVPGERRSSAMGKLSTFPQLLGVPAPLIGGLIYQAFGFGAPMAIRLFMLILSFSIVFLFVAESSSKS